MTRWTILGLSLLLTATVAARGQDVTPVYYNGVDDGKVEGVVGKAGPVRGLDARGVIDLERGTLAFFRWQDNEPQVSEWNRFAGVNSMRGGGYWGMVLGFDVRLEDFVLNFYDVGRYAPPLKLPSIFGRWQANTWHHLAVSWDRQRGVKVYEDGQLVASNWGSYAWHWNNFPETLSLAGTVDEVYVFAEVLADAQLAQLAKGQKPTGPAPALDGEPAARVKLDQQAYGWTADELAQLPRVAAGAGVALQFARFVGAIDSKRAYAQVFEGLMFSTWPDDMYSATLCGKRLDLLLEPGSRFDRVRLFLQRPFTGELRAAKAAVSVPSAADPATLGSQLGMSFMGELPATISETPLLQIGTAHAQVWHHQLNQMVEADRMVLTREVGMVGQVDFYRATPAGQLNTAAPKLTFNAVDALPECETSQVLIGQTTTRWRRFAVAQSAAGEAVKHAAPAFGGFQAVTEFPTDAQALTGVAVTLVVEPLTEPTPVRVTIKEPVNGMRDWLIGDVLLEPRAGATGPQQYVVVLEGRPVINLPARRVPNKKEMIDVPGTPLGVAVVVGAPATFHLGAGGCTIQGLSTTLEKALPAAADDQVEFMRQTYSTVMEGHAYRDKALVAAMTWLAKFAPQRLEFRQMYERVDKPIWFEGQDVPPLVRPEVQNDTGAPDWAFSQMQNLREHRRLTHWRIDHWQLANGEMGGVWNDDTIHVENWLGMALALDDEGRIKQAIRKLCDGNWLHLDEQGVGRYVQDACHYYEEGSGIQAMRLLIDYGDPVVVNRILTAASHLEPWLQRNSAGVYIPQSEYYSLNEVWTMRNLLDPKMAGHRADPLVPAAYLVWYNRHPQGLAYHRGHGFVNALHGHAAMAELSYPARLEQLAQTLTKPIDRYGPQPQLDALCYVPVTDAMRQLYGGAFVEPKPIGHYWGARDTDAHYFNWKISGDNRWLVASDQRVLDWFYSHDWVNTAAQPSRDRCPLPRFALIRARLGGLAANRGSMSPPWPQHAWSIERGANDAAVLVRENLPTRLVAQLYPFTQADHAMAFRLWRLLPGRYRFTLQRDANDDGVGEQQLWTSEQDVTRGSRLNLTLPAGQLSLLTVEALETHEPQYDLPDAAIGAGTVDLVYDEHLVVKVYNLGTQPAENVRVRVCDGRSGQVVLRGEQVIDRIDAPLDFQPRYRAVEFKNINANTLGSIIIEVDPEGQTPDLNRDNNRYELRF